MNAIPPRPTPAMERLEVFRGQFFTRYNVDDRDLTEVMQIMNARHGIDGTRKDYNTKITEWSFGKRYTRPQVMEFLRELRLVQDGLPLPHTSPRRPIDIQRIQAYCVKNQIEVEAGLWDYAELHEFCRGIWSIDLGELTLDDHCIRPAEEFLYQCQILTKASFESGQWHSISPELLIESSPVTKLEKGSLHQFLGHVRLASEAASYENYPDAMTHWHQASHQIHRIVNGHYHDLLPNLVQTLSILCTTGHRNAARHLVAIISDCSQHYSRAMPTPSTAAFALFSRLDLETIVELAEQLMRIFTGVFNLYLGERNFSVFVMRIDSARSKLLGDANADPNDWIPDVSSLDEDFGPADRRSLLAIFLRVEVMHHRMLYPECQTAAVMMIRRALMIREDEDPWQRLHFLTQGYYYLGTCHYLQGSYSHAAYSFNEARKTEMRFSRVEPADVFFAQRSHMEEMLANISTARRLSGCAEA